jgi:hypothetical protein
MQGSMKILLVVSSVALVASVSVLILGLLILDPRGAVEEPESLFDASAAEMAQIRSVVLSQGKARVKLINHDSKWLGGGDSPAAGHDVDRAAIAGLIRFVNNAKYLEKKTNKAEKLGRLGLADNEHLALLVIDRQNGTEEVLIGKTSNAGLGTYIRFPSSSQAWLVSGQLEVSANVIDWISPVFLDIDRSEISRAKFVSPQGESVIISAAGETESAIIENMPDGDSLAYSSVADSALLALVNLRLINVARQDQFSWDHASTALFELSAGSTIILKCLEQNGEYWVSTSGGGVVGLWSYRIDEHRYKQLTKKMSDYLATESSDGR